MRIQTTLVNASSDTHDGRRDQCIEALKQWDLVAFPTETVYGLWANAYNDHAVKKIFETKGRPQDNPLIVHIASFQQLEKIAKNIPDRLYAIIDEYRPWPLTIIVPKTHLVPDRVTCWLDTVAIRFPAHPIAQRLIQETNVPLVWPSANISWRPSPTRADHVFQDFAWKIPFIIDWWPSEIGIESSVIAYQKWTIHMYRQWGITKEMLEKKMGINVVLANKATPNPRSPWLKYKHYAPHATVTLVAEEKRDAIVSLFSHDPQKKFLAYENAQHMAYRLFHDFRQADSDGYTEIFIKALSNDGLWSGVMERVKKAAWDDEKYNNFW
jgi:L-threonylcarbamoyladenylate synthase